MKAHHGYEDGSGSYVITIDTERCNGCGDCVAACPAGVLELVEEDPLEEELVAAVGEAHRKRLRYACEPCKRGAAALPCVACCEPAAIVHSW